MNEQAMKFRIGVFVLAALLLLAVLITLFGSFPRLLTRGTEYTVRFAQAPGLGAGTPVRRSGVRVGEVRRVELNDVTGDVRAVILVERPYTIRKNEVAVLTHGLLGGDVAIDFQPRRDEAEPADRSPVEPGAEIVGQLQPTFAALLNQAGDVLPTTQEALNDIRKSVQRFEKLAPAMEEAIKEYRDLAKASREMVPELKKTNEEVRDLVKVTRETMPEVRKAAAEVGELAKASRESFPDLRKTNDEVRELIKAVRETVPEVKKTTQAVGELAKATQDTLPELKKTNEEVRKAATNVADLAQTVKESVPDLKKTNDEVRATFITWQKAGERVKLLVETNEKKLEDTLDNLNKTLQNVSSTLNESNRRNFEDILKNVNEGTRNLKTLSQGAEEFVREGTKTMRKVGDSVGKVDEVMGNLQAATKPLAERGGNVVKNLDESTARLNDILADVQALFRALDKSDGTLKRFLTDPSLYQKLDEIVCGAARLMPRLERVLRDVEVFADKIARHPESLGVGGAVRPSAGLKESPTATPLVPWGKPSGQ